MRTFFVILVIALICFIALRSLLKMFFGKSSCCDDQNNSCSSKCFGCDHRKNDNINKQDNK